MITVAFLDSWYLKPACAKTIKLLPRYITSHFLFIHQCQKKKKKLKESEMTVFSKCLMLADARKSIQKLSAICHYVSKGSARSYLSTVPAFAMFNTVHTLCISERELRYLGMYGYPEAESCQVSLKFSELLEPSSHEGLKIVNYDMGEINSLGTNSCLWRFHQIPYIV